MTREEAIEAIKCNWPDSRYTILREALDMAVKALEDVTDKNVEKMTNADRIRAMSDKELAEFIKNIKVRAALCKAVKNNDAFEELCSAEWLQRPAEEDDMTDCKHEFVYDELHGEIVCKFCGYVLTADDKRELHRKAFELMEEEDKHD